MINDIKMDKVHVPQVQGAKISNGKQPVADGQQEGVTVTNHLNSLVKLLADSSDGQPSSHSNSAAVADIKNKIQSNQYKVDFNALSEKLLGSGVLVDG